MDGNGKEQISAFHRPTNVVATFEDEFGDTKFIHRPKGGRAVRLAKNVNTPALRMNRAAARLIGEKIRAKRLAACMSLEDLAKLAGLASQTPKQYMWQIEKAIRHEGVRTGTLFALAYALGCEVSEFLPTVAEVAAAADVKMQTKTALA